MIWHVATSTRFRDSREEIKRWTFDQLIAGCELIDAMNEAEQEYRDRAEQTPEGS